MKEAFYKGLLNGFKGHYNLQMFAEDGEEPNGDNDGGSGNDTDNNINEEKYTDEDVNRIIQEKLARIKKKQEKDIDEAKKLAEMNAQQKAEYERDKIRKELDELKNQQTLNEMSKTARKMLSDEGINIDDDLLSNLVTTDAEKTKEMVTSFCAMFQKAVASAVKEELKGDTPAKNSNKKTLTKEQILAIKNAAERKKLIAENIHLFDK